MRTTNDRFAGNQATATTDSWSAHRHSRTNKANHACANGAMACARAAVLALLLTTDLTAQPIYPKEVVKSFGVSVALDSSGTALVVGTAESAGAFSAAYVFVKQDNNKWEQAAVLKGKGQQASHPGLSVSINGNTVVVGAGAAQGTNKANEAGAAFIYLKPKGGWKDTSEPDAILTASNPQADANFGHSVSITGPGPDGRQYVVVGSPGESKHTGAAYVFVSSIGGKWENDKDKNYRVENYRLTTSAREEGDRFGTSVSFGGNNQALVVGASTINSAYVFLPPRGTQSGQPVWQPVMNGTATETATLSPKGDTGSFGKSVSFSGDTVAVGAPFAKGADSSTGAAFVFVQPRDGWQQNGVYKPTAKLTAKEGKTPDALGSSVSTTGSIALAGAPMEARNLGAVFDFVRLANGWTNMTESKELLVNRPPLMPGKDSFGKSVSIAASTIAVGAPDAQGWGIPDKGTGMVWIFSTSSKKSGVKLDQSTSPGSGASGVNYLTLSGSGFPDGSISPDNVAVQLSTVCHGPASAITPAASLVSGSGDSRLVSFLLPAGLPPGNYFVSMSDSVEGDANFESGNCSEVSVSQ